MVDKQGKRLSILSLISHHALDVASTLGKLHALLFLKDRVDCTFPLQGCGHFIPSPFKKNQRPNNTTHTLTSPHTQLLVVSFLLDYNCLEVMDNSPFSLPQHRAQTLVGNLRYSINNCLINKWQVFEHKRLTHCAQTERLCSGG